jgi:hypothetical protein
MVACGTPISGTADAVSIATSSTPIGDRVVMDEKTAYAAEVLYNIPAQAYVSADTRGLITPELRATIRPKLIYMASLLDAVRAAYKVGDATSFSARWRELQALKDQVTPLIPGS